MQTLNGEASGLVPEVLHVLYFAAGSGFAAFRNAYLEEIGLSGVEIGAVGFLVPVVGIVAQPVWGLVSDWGNLEKEVLLVGVVVTGLTASVYPAVARTGLVVLAGASAVISAFRAPVRPVANALVLSTGLDYGTVRAFGSLAFGGAVLALGVLVSRVGTEVVFYVYAGGMALVALLLTRVPVAASPPATGIGREVRRLVRNRAFLALLCTAFLVGTLLSTAGSYFAIYMRAIGAGDGLTGLALAIKTVAEAAVFLRAYRLDVRYRTLLIAGCLAHVGTFLVYAAVPVTGVVLAVQLLLGLGYATVTLAAVNLAHEVAPVALQSTAQTLLAAVGFGAGAGAGELLAGRLMDLVGVQSMYGYVALLGVVAAGTGLAVSGAARTPGATDA